MAIAHVQSKVDSAGGGATSFLSLPSVGNIVVVGIAFFNATANAVPTDNQGNTYVLRQQVHELVSGNWISIYTAKVNTSSGTFTVSHVAGDSIVIAEYSGVDTVSPFVNGSKATAAGGTPSVYVYTPKSNQLVIGVAYDDGPGTQVAGSGFTIRGQEIDNATHERIVYEDGIFAASGYNLVTYTAFGPNYGIAAIALAESFTVPSPTAKTAWHTA
jgi:hypothetical protein